MATPAYESSYLHRRKRLLFIPPIIGLLTGFLGSFFFSPRCTSQSTLLLRLPNRPPFASLLSTAMIEKSEVMLRVATSTDRMRPALRSLNLLKSGQSEDQLIEDIRAHLTLASEETH
jgi:hypothetical protein